MRVDSVTGPRPSRLLASARDGYLSPRQRPGHADWAASDTHQPHQGQRPDGKTTSIRGALTALRTLRARSGVGETGYEPDDYLDQHTRRLREACLGPRELWDAMVECADADDLNRLGN